MLGYLSFLGRRLLMRGPLECTFFITSRCNFRCHHCFFWREVAQREKNELTLEQIEKLAQTMPPMLRLLITGGEPFIRRDLPEICRAFYSSCRPKHISIPSNGFLTDKILRDTEKILAWCPGTKFNISLSLDEIGDKRDRMVEVEDSFKTLLETGKGLQELKKRHPNLALTVIVVQTAENESRINEIIDFAVEEMEVDNVGFGHVRVGPEDEDLLKISPEVYRATCDRLIADYKKKQAKKLPFGLSKVFLANRELVYEYKYDVLLGKARYRRCFSGDLRAVIREDGTVYPCETLMDNGDLFSFGNLKNYNMDFKELWKNKRRKEVMSRITDQKCVCGHGCDVTTNMLFSVRNWPKHISRSFKY